MSYENVSRWIREVPEHLKTQEMCNEAVEVDPWQLYDVPEMCDKA